MPVHPNHARVFVVLPAFNESKTIRGVVDQLVVRYPDVVVVDDGSSDETSGLLEGANVYVLRHHVNRGQGAALQTGIRFALLRGADVVVTFDADGQHDVTDIDTLVGPVLNGECDIALGSRFLGSAPNIPLNRRVLLKLGVLFTRALSGIRASDVHNGLRAFSRDAADALRISMDRMAHASEIFEQIRIHNWRYKEIPVTVRYTAYSLAKGQSSWEAVRIALQVILEKFRQ